MTAAGAERFDSAQEYLLSTWVGWMFSQRLLCYSQYELQWLLGLCLLLTYLVDRLGPQAQKVQPRKVRISGAFAAVSSSIGMATGELL
jgi:hypothetical protein